MYAYRTCMQQLRRNAKVRKSTCSSMHAHDQTNACARLRSAGNPRRALSTTASSGAAQAASAWACLAEASSAQEARSSVEERPSRASTAVCFFLQQSRSPALLANSFGAPWPLRGRRRSPSCSRSQCMRASYSWLTELGRSRQARALSRSTWASWQRRPRRRVLRREFRRCWASSSGGRP